MAKNTKFTSFNEYLSDKGKVVEKATTEKVADYKGPKPNSPQKWGDWPESADSKKKKKPKGNPAPYSGPGEGSYKIPKAEKGLGDEGDKNLADNYSEKSKEKTPPTWPKTQTEQFIDATKDMSVSEFTQFMAERTTRGGIEFEAIRYIASNPIALNALIREAKRAGTLDKIAEAMLSVPDAHSALVETLSENQMLKTSFVTALEEKVLESVGPAFHKLGGEEEGMGDLHKKGKPNHGSDDLNMDDEEDDDDDDMDDDDDDLDMDDEEDDDDEDDMDDDLEGPEPEPSGSLDGGKSKPLDREMMDKVKKFMRGI